MDSQVLVVEDEKQLRDLVCLHLGVAGYECGFGRRKGAMLLAGERPSPYYSRPDAAGDRRRHITRAIRRNGPTATPRF